MNTLRRYIMTMAILAFLGWGKAFGDNVCQINNQGSVTAFPTIKAALEYARDEMGGTATIEMIVAQHSLSSSVNIVRGDFITITTASSLAEPCVIFPSKDNYSLFKLTGTTHDDASLTLTNIILDGAGHYSGTQEDSYSGYKGGAVYAYRGHFIMENGAVIRNFQAEDGGAAYLKENLFTMSGGTIGGNTASQWGGGICLYGGEIAAELEMTGGLITNNEAQNGGGICFVASSGVISGGEISGNRAIDNSGYGGYGGGIDLLDENESVTVTGTAVITGNTATLYGGGVYSVDVFYMTGGAIYGNTTASNEPNTAFGSDIYSTGYISLIPAATMGQTLNGIPIDGWYYDGTFDPNTWTYLYWSEGNPTEQWISLEGNQQEIALIAAYSHPICQIQDGIHNVVKTFYCIPAAVDYAHSQMSGQATIEMLVDHHEVKDQVELYEGDNITLTSVEGQLFTLFSGQDGISMFWIKDNRSLTLTNIVLDGKTEYDPNMNSYTHLSNYGGAVYVEDGTLTIGAGATLQNFYSYGGAVYVQNGTCSMTGGAITNNVSQYDGGGVYITSEATFNMGGGIISNNTAMNHGGGICDGDESFINLTGGVITGNKATQGGGVHACYCQSFSMSDNAVVYGNQAEDIAGYGNPGGADLAISCINTTLRDAAAMGQSLNGVPIDGWYIDGDYEEGFQRWSLGGENNLPWTMLSWEYDDYPYQLMLIAANDPVVCQIQDNINNQLKQFRSIQAAVDYAEANMNGVATIEMLVDNYQPLGNPENQRAVQLSTGDNITLTSVGNNVFTVSPGEGNISLFYVPTGASLTLTNITLDGRNGENNTLYSGSPFSSSAVGGSQVGGAVLVDGGQLTIDAGATLKDFYADLGAAVFSYNGNVTVKEGALLTGNKAENGGGAIMLEYNQPNGSFVMSGGSISENHSNGMGGALYVITEAASCNFTINGGHFNNNHAQYGGAIYTEISDYTNNTINVSINNVEITGNTAEQYGGGIASYGNNTFNIQNSVISGNHSSYGGGIYAEAKDFSIANSTISGNQSSYYGGGLYIVGTGNDSSVFTMGEDCMVSNNTVSSTSNEARGGGAYITGFYNVNLNEGSSFVENAITGNGTYGGGVYVSEAENLYVHGAVITGNTATCANSYAYGGGLSTSSVEYTYISNGSTISNNTSSGYDAQGGGIYCSSEGFEITNSTITGNTNNGSYQSFGGGVRAYGTIEVTNSTITGNKVDGSNQNLGGGIYSTSSISLDGGAICNNTAMESDYSGNAGGSDIYAEQTLTIINPVNVGQTFSTTGIAIDGWYLDGYTDGDGNYLRWSESNPTEQWTPGSGTSSLIAAYTFPVCQIQIPGQETQTFTSIQSAVDYAEEHLSRVATIEMLIDNHTLRTAASSGNGLVELEEGDDIQLTSVEGNVYTILSGRDDYSLFYVPAGASFTLANIKIDGQSDYDFTNQTATYSYSNGGAVYVEGGALTIESGTVLKNFYSNSGGAVYLEGGNFTMNGGSISRNVANYGGGLYAYNDGSTPQSSILIHGGSITNNQSQYHGGGLYLEGNVMLTMEESEGEITIADNISNQYGGGIYLAEVPAEIKGGQIINNKATGNPGNNYGGGIAIYKGPFTMSGGIISGNEAYQGGGLYIEESTFTMTGDAEITGNRAVGGYGGGISFSYGDFIMQGGAIYANTSVPESNQNPETGGGADLYILQGQLLPAADMGKLLNGTPIDGWYLDGYYDNDGNYLRWGEANPTDEWTELALDGTGDYLLLIAAYATPVCQIQIPGQETQTFTSIQSAVDYAEDNLNGQATIEMLVDHHGLYSRVELAEGDNITLTSVEGQLFTIQPAKNGINLFHVPEGANFTLTNITLDGLGNLNPATWYPSWDTGLWEYMSADGGAAYVNGGTLSIQTGTTIQNFYSNQYGPVFVEAGEVKLYDGAVISGNVATNHGAAFGLVPTNSGQTATLTMHGGLINGNKTEEQGGAIFMQGRRLYSGNVNAFFVMTGGEISNNKIDDEGGGAICMNYGEFTMSGGLITGNSSPQWGGAIAAENSKLDIVGGSITGNTVSASIQGGGGIFANSCDITLNGGSITGNMVNGSGSGNAYGGGIYATSGSLYLVCGTLCNNSAECPETPTYAGAADLYSSSNHVEVEPAMNWGATFGDTGNPVNAWYYDGVYDNNTWEYMRWSMDHPTEQWTALESNGEELRLIAVYDSNAPEISPICQIQDEGNNTVVQFPNIQLAVAYAESMMGGTATIEMLVTEYGITRMVQISGNDNITLTTVENSDDAIYTIKIAKDEISMFFVGEGASLTLTNITLDGDGNYSEDPYHYDHISGSSYVSPDPEGWGESSSSCGGAVIVERGDLVIEEGATIQNFYIEDKGTVYLNEGSFTMNGGSIKNNYVRGYGGAVFANEAELLMTGGEMVDNVGSEYAGAVLMIAGNFVMTDGLIARNAQYDGWGGGLMFYGGSFTMQGGSISDNQGNIGGGAIAGLYGTTVRIEDGTISGNSAEQGAGIYLEGGAFYPNPYSAATLEITGGSISNNLGGGVYAYESNITMSDGEISNNTVDEYGKGGGVYLTGYDGYPAEFNMTGGTISGNEVHGFEYNDPYYHYGCGGGVYVDEHASFTMSGTATITGNQADYDGGGVFLSGDSFVMEGGSITDNRTISGHGGGFYLDGELKVSGLVFITDNMVGPDENMVQENVYFTTDHPHLLFDQALDCASRIGVTKDFGFEDDDNFTEVRTLIATDETTGSGLALKAYQRNVFFDDKDVCFPVCFNYTNTDGVNYDPANAYTTDKLYLFAETWFKYASNAADDFAEDDNDITIKSAAGLAHFAKMVCNGTDYAGKTVTLTHDVDMSAHLWVPIGLVDALSCYDDETDTDEPFLGTFDGGGHIISGLNSYLPVKGEGLFGLVGRSGIVKNTFVKGGDFTSTYVAETDDRTYESGLVGELRGGILAYSESAATLDENTESAMGGLVGHLTANGTLHSSMAMATMSGTHTMGGLVGMMEANTTLANSFANAKFTGTGSAVGGLVGSNAGTVGNCYVMMQEESAPGTNFGWVAGTGEGTIQYCYIPEGNDNYIGDAAPDLATCGTYTATDLENGKYKYGMPDQRVGTEPNDVPLVNLLNAKATVTGYAQWSRTMASPINGDYPVLMLPGFSNLATATDNNIFLQYRASLNEAITTYNADGGNIFVYDAPKNGTDDEEVNVNNNATNHLYIHENVGILQATGNVLNARVGVTFDNSSNNMLGGKNYDWHMFSTSLSDAPLGIQYKAEPTNGVGYGNEIVSGDITLLSSGYFPEGTPFTSFDYYSYYEPEYHWINFKRNTGNHWHEDENHDFIDYHNEDDSPLVKGKGYMMAIDKETTLMANGTLTNEDFSIDVTATGDVPFKGANLIGNPYQSYLDFEEFAKDGGENSGLIRDKAYYILDADHGGYITYPEQGSENPVYAPRYLHPHQGFMVKVENTTTLSFTDAMRVAGRWEKGLDSDNPLANSSFREERINYPLVNLICTDSDGRRDFTTVEINRPEQGGARKLQKMHAGDASLYAHFNNQSYQALFAPMGVREVPVRLEVYEDGVFTMTWSMLHGDFSYVHLIDNLTGADIDLTTTDSYRFEASTDDYASRFRLVFDVTGIEEYDDDQDGLSTGSGTFAFFDGNAWVVNGEGTLQLFDVNGRCLMSTNAEGTQSSVNLPKVATGVYLLRLTNGNGTRVQKIVIP